MARLRTASNVLELRGAFRKNPKRGRARANEPKPTQPLGPPPAALDDVQRQAWHDIAATCPAHVLFRRDRLMVETASRLLAHIRTTPMADIPAAMVARLESHLARLGMTPSDASRVSVMEPRPANVFDDV